MLIKYMQSFLIVIILLLLKQCLSVFCLNLRVRQLSFFVVTITCYNKAFKNDLNVWARACA